MWLDNRLNAARVARCDAVTGVCPHEQASEHRQGGRGAATVAHGVWGEQASGERGSAQGRGKRGRRAAVVGVERPDPRGEDRAGVLARRART